MFFTGVTWTVRRSHQRQLRSTRGRKARELHTQCILARSATKKQTGKQVYGPTRSWCGVFDVSQRKCCEWQDNGLLLQCVTNRSICGFALLRFCAVNKNWLYFEGNRKKKMESNTITPVHYWVAMTDDNIRPIRRGICVLWSIVYSLVPVLVKCLK